MATATKDSTSNDAKNASVRVEIFDQAYNLRGSDPEYILKLAEYVDAKMRAVAEATNTIDTVRLAVLAALISYAASQETTLHTQSNVVLILALVKNQQGGIVYGLQARDFIIEDDGVEQPVRLDEPAEESQPISLVIAIQSGRRASYEFPRIQ